MPYTPSAQDVTQRPSWRALSEHRQALDGFNLRPAYADDPQRFERFSLDDCGLFLDYSKNLIDQRTRGLLVDLATDAGLTQAIAALFEGAQVNASERRPALHTALRRPLGDRVLVDGEDVMPQVHRALLRMSELVGRVHHGLWRGYSDKP
ncbi:MAG: glucose-6-phosphate isomerase, partial [Pseudomonas sp.]|nr:glucose-6-phosphate isomerase [Pseudomonas sp.]